MPSALRSEIRFWFRGEVLTVSGMSPQKTVLRWLREDQAAVGTKEGCGEGDCGACTVTVGSLDPQASQGLRLRAVNSCLLFLPALDGKALFTVEDVASGEDLHPVQRALVDHHASQCGFCTPGFVMSLWSDYQERSGPPSRTEASSVLSGNLCRCTGYRPILDAAREAWGHPVVKVDRQPIVQKLTEIQALPSLTYEHGGQTWNAPRSLDELTAVADLNPDARIVAGATDVGLWVTKGLRNLGSMISLGAVEDLKEIEQSDDELRIGAGVSLTDALGALVDRYSVLADWADRFASPPVRHAGTLGGNVANGSPIGDSMPVLLALNAVIGLQKASRYREMPLEEFYLGYQKTAREPGEVVTLVRIPDLPSQASFRVWKVSKRRDQDISAVCGAFVVIRDGDGVTTEARLAYGGMAAIPARARTAEAALRGRIFDHSALADARGALDADFTPLSDGRSSASYRQTVAKNLLTQFHTAVGWTGNAL